MTDHNTRARVEHWARNVVAPRVVLEDAEPPRFAHECVQAAYMRLEAGVIRLFRSGNGFPAGLHHMTAHRVRVLRAIDSAWAEPTGFVYMASARREADHDRFGICKIGFSGDPESRLKSIQTGCHFQLVIQYVPGTEQVERAMHRALDEYRTQGEWFDLKSEVDDAFTMLSMVSAEWALGRRRSVAK